MAYVSYDRAPTIGAASRTETPLASTARIAWGRIALVAVCAAFWVGLIAVAIR